MENTISQIAQIMLLNLEEKKRNNGDSYYRNKIKVDWQKDIIHKAHSFFMPDDYKYRFIRETLMLLYDNNVIMIDQAEELIEQIGSDIYTADLTKWLNSNTNRVYYLTQAKEECLIKSGIDLLSYAQTLEKIEVAHLILHGIVDYIKDLKNESI